MKQLLALFRSAEARQGIMMGLFMIAAGGLDYAVNVLAGRWLVPVQYGIFVSITAILQVLMLLAIAIRMVVAFYTAELAAREETATQVGPFVRLSWRWAWRWGLIATVVTMVCGPLLARWLWLPNAWPVWAASLMMVMLFVREACYGALQGTVEFTGLGAAQVILALLRIAFAAAFVWLGGQATGAILAQPLACGVLLIIMMRWLGPLLRQPEVPVERSVSWGYALHTVAGLAAFGLLTNLDAIFVKRYYSPEVAGDYGPVVTLAKISLFLPWAIGIVLFPKVTQRQATGRDPRPILWFSLAAALAPGLAVTLYYFISPGLIVNLVFRNSYHNPGMVLALASLAATLYAGMNIWLNYALSLGRQAFTYVLLGLVVVQLACMLTFGRGNLVNMTLCMAAAGLVGNLMGMVATRSAAPGAVLEPIKASAFPVQQLDLEVK
jgi:O-antigen/teichoic acid export membrane protein